MYKPVDGFRSLLIQVRNILRGWALNVLHDQIRDYTMPEAIVDLRDTRCWAARS
jgi:hypothetical protein